MEKKKKKYEKQLILPAGEFDVFLQALNKAGYEIIGPTVEDQAIVFDTITSSSELPTGWTDEQNAGSYRLHKTEENLFFDFNVSPHSWKKRLHLANLLLWQAKTNGSGFSIAESNGNIPKQAFLGVRSCDAAAIEKQDKIFLQGDYIDTAYKSRRDQTLIITVNCSKAGGNCFCTSMETGPYAKSGYDLSLTEIKKNGRYFFYLEIGSDEGASVLAGMPALEEASVDDDSFVRDKMREVSKMMKKNVDTTDIKSLFYDNYDNSIWTKIAERCMNCANCTMVCPTCFCTNVEDVTDLTGAEAERWRRWDSCFTMDFSYIHGGSVRPSAANRYRHWITHKFAAWHDQFDESGCVGCGRCITWCPVGIDITQEIQNLRKSKTPV
ncbi:MAG: sulfite reductase subunit A [Calditrichaeota bacterium]|nr:MAG: sulfite reductase subunit A [Calditrichota bacterium]